MVVMWFVAGSFYVKNLTDDKFVIFFHMTLAKIFFLMYYYIHNNLIFNYG